MLASRLLTWLRRTAANLALAAVATSLALFLAEGVLRLQQARWLTRPRVEYRMEHDTLLGWVKPASATGVRWDDEYEVLETTNAYRLRGPEVTLDRPAGVRRVLLLGDSFAEGYTVSFDSSFAEVLHRGVNVDPARPVQLLNSGTAGWSTDQELLYYRRDGRAFGADLVVVLFYLNDVTSNASQRYWRGRKPWFALDVGDTTLTLQGVPVPAPATTTPRGPDELQDAEAPPSPSGGVLGRSLLYQQLRRTVLRSPSLLAIARRLHLTTATEPLRPAAPNEWEVWRTEETPRVAQGWLLTRALLQALRREVEGDGARFVVVHAPAREVIHPAFWDAAHRRFRIDTSAYRPGREEGELAAICNDLELECFFLRPALRDATGAAGDPDAARLYWTRDPHWNARGNRVAGEAVARYLREAWLGGGSR